MARWSFTSVSASPRYSRTSYWWPMWRSPSVLSTVATLQVTAGQTYRLWVYYGRLGPIRTAAVRLDNIHRVRTGAGPPGCEFAPPVSNWVCVDGGGWVPPDHPLALGNPPSSPPPTPAPEMPPVAGPAGCTMPRPVETWVCANGGWVPSHDPLALANPPSSPPPTPAPEMPPVRVPVGRTMPTRPVETWVCVTEAGPVPITRLRLPTRRVRLRRRPRHRDGPSRRTRRVSNGATCRGPGSARMEAGCPRIILWLWRLSRANGTP